MNALKNCADCAMCCMIMGIRELDKPRSVWCPHCPSKVSCAIYESRPNECRTFNCGYLTVSYLGDEWKPSKSKIVLAEEIEGRRITAYIDPKRADAWKKEPYYSTLKNWSKIALAQNRQVLVTIDWRVYAIFPDQDVNLGVVDEDHHVITEPAPAHPRGVEAHVVHKDDPRIQAFLAQPWRRAG